MKNYNFGDTYNNVGEVKKQGTEIRAVNINNIDLSKTKIEITTDEIIKIIQELKNELNNLDLRPDDMQEAKSYLTIVESNVKKENKEKTADNLNNLLTMTTNTGKILAETSKIAPFLIPLASWLGHLSANYPIFSQIFHH